MREKTDQITSFWPADENVTCIQGFPEIKIFYRCGYILLPSIYAPETELRQQVGGGRRNIYLHMLNIMDLLKTALVCTSAIAHQVEGGGRVRVKHEETVSGESSEEEKEHF